MIAQRSAGWHLASFSFVKSHMNLVAVMSNALEMLEEANEQMFRGDCKMAQRLRNWVVLLHGHDGEFSFMVNHGLLMRTEAPFFGVFDRTFKRWKKDSQTALSTMLRAPFAGIGCASLRRSWSSCADDFFIKDDFTAPHSGGRQGYHPE